MQRMRMSAIPTLHLTAEQVASDPKFRTTTYDHKPDTSEDAHPSKNIGTRQLLV